MSRHLDRRQETARYGLLSGCLFTWPKVPLHLAATTLEHVGMPAQLYAAQSQGLVETGMGTLEALPAPPQPRSRDDDQHSGRILPVEGQAEVRCGQAGVGGNVRS